MSRRVLLESECDYSIHTYVPLKKRRGGVPNGWALNLVDIREFIPVLRYEFECYIQIKGIIAPCRIRINPRLFYKGSAIRRYLLSLKEKKDNDEKVCIELKFNKKELNKSLDSFDVFNGDYIDTKLLVGKSYSSRGWGLSKEVVSKIVPLDAYDYIFPAYVDNIPVETRINMQTRLFYTSKDLSEELEKLYKIDPKQKVDARIILNEAYLNSIKELRKGLLSDNKCIICGNNLDRDSKNNKCYDCLDKELTVLKLKKILEYFSPAALFYEEDLLDLGYTKGQIIIFVNKLEKHDLISVNWDGSFQLKDQTTLDKFINNWG